MQRRRHAGQCSTVPSPGLRFPIIIPFHVRIAIFYSGSRGSATARSFYNPFGQLLVRSYGSAVTPRIAMLVADVGGGDRNWASLPVDLIVIVLDMLEAQRDIDACSGVNRHWRSARAGIHRFRGDMPLPLLLSACRSLQCLAVVNRLRLAPSDVDALRPGVCPDSLDCLDLSRVRDPDATFVDAVRSGRITMRLTTLSLARWRLVSDTSFLSSLTALHTLNLSQTSIREVDGLTCLRRLRSVDVSSTGVSSVAPLMSCSELEVLDISFTRVDDLSSLQDHRCLQTIKACHLVRQAEKPVICPGTLRHLEVCHSRTTASILPDLIRRSANLEHLSLNGTATRGIDTLAHLFRLRVLLLESCRHVLNIDAVRFFPGLTTLSVAKTGVDRIDALQFCPLLQRLDISETSVNDVSVLRLHLRDVLLALDADYTKIGDLDALANFSRLRHLSARHTGITSVDVLATCPSLQCVDIAHTQVRSTAALAGLKWLRCLDASSSPVAHASLPRDGSWTNRFSHSGYDDHVGLLLEHHTQTPEPLLPRPNSGYLQRLRVHCCNIV